MRRLIAGLAASLLTLVVGTLLNTSVAAAHAKLESMVPADGSTMAAPPQQVVLTFNEPVGSTGAQVVVKGPSGIDEATGAPEVRDNVVTQPVGAMTEAGRYQVDIRIVSADGHLITASAGFTVTHEGHAPVQRQPKANPQPPPASGSPTVVIVAMVLVMLVVVALAVVIVRRRPGPEAS